MRYEILGPLRLCNGHETAYISARKIETLLAVLLSKPNQVIFTEQLITEIWGETPPRRARAALHVYISQLRKILGADSDEPNPVVTKPNGYLLRLANEDLDLNVYRRLVHQGRAHFTAGRFVDAANVLNAALDLWHGPALEELRSSPAIDRFASWLDQSRIETTERFIEANLMIDQHYDMIGLLYQLVDEHPLHENFYRQLMLALYRAGRRADALEIYRVARETMNRELGLEPCRPLTELQRRILLGNDEFEMLQAN